MLVLVPHELNINPQEGSKRTRNVPLPPQQRAMHPPQPPQRRNRHRGAPCLRCQRIEEHEGWLADGELSDHEGPNGEPEEGGAGEPGLVLCYCVAAVEVFVDGGGEAVAAGGGGERAGVRGSGGAEGGAAARGL